MAGEGRQESTITSVGSCVLMRESNSAERGQISSDDIGVLGIAIAAVVGISAAGGAWELLESTVGLILLVALSLLMGHAKLRDSTLRRQVLFSGVAALCATLAFSWPLQAAVFCRYRLNVNDEIHLREFDDRWLFPFLLLSFVVIFCLVRWWRPAGAGPGPNRRRRRASVSRLSYTRCRACRIRSSRRGNGRPPGHRQSIQQSPATQHDMET